MKNFVKIVFSLSILCSPLSSQAEEISSDGGAQESLHSWSFGFNLAGLGTDWGTGVYLSSPTFGKSRTSLSFSANNFYIGGNGGSDLTYTHIIMAVSKYNLITEAVRVYERIGLGAVVPDKRISSQLGMNGLAVLGMEYFLPSKNHFYSFYGEFGVSALIIHRFADRLPGSPRYASGALALIGTRYYF